MTEAEWLAATDPTPMLEFLQGKVGNRKMRLFCCACCRRMWHRLGWSKRRAVEIAEQCADGTAGWWGSLWGEVLGLSGGFARNAEREPGAAARMAVHVSGNPWPGGPKANGVAVTTLVARLTRGDDPTGATGATLAALLREVVGPLPFREQWSWQRRGLLISPERLTSTVVALASGMYESRDFAAMPILGDALQDAGCENTDILSHCRQPGEHVRGCWVVDLVLGKSQPKVRVLDEPEA